jgi:hypothetical protein
MKGYAAITDWVADVPSAILTDLYLRSGAPPVPPPSKTTIWRVLTDADPGALDAAVGTWLMNLAGFTAPAVAAQAEVGKKTNEVPMAAVVLGQAGLAGKVVTADALHTVKATADHIHEHGGEFVLPVKENRRALFDALDALPWGQVPVAIPPPTRATAGSPPAPSRSCPPPTTCRSRTSVRCSLSSGTSPACTAS